MPNLGLNIDPNLLPYDPGGMPPTDPSEAPLGVDEFGNPIMPEGPEYHRFKPNVLGPNGITYVWDPASQSYVPQDAYGQPTPVPPDPDIGDDTDIDDPPIDDWEPTPEKNKPVIGPDGEIWVWDPNTNSYRPKVDPTDPWDPGNWQDPPWQFPFPWQRPSANWQYPMDQIGEIWKWLAQQGMSGDWATDLNTELRDAQNQQNAFNLRRMIEEAALTRQESRQGFLGPLLEKLITGVSGTAGQVLGSGVGPVGAVLRGLGMHSRYVEGGEGEGAGPMTVMDKPRRFTGMLPASTSGRLGAAGEQFAQALGSRGETVRQQAEERVGRASAAQATQARSQAGQQGLGLSGQVIGMQRQAERLADAKRRSKRGVLKPVLQELMGQV
jgi:hypothetical protein